jgi:hypothetical protein
MNRVAHESGTPVHKGLRFTKTRQAGSGIGSIPRDKKGRRTEDRVRGPGRRDIPRIIGHSQT